MCNNTKIIGRFRTDVTQNRLWCRAAWNCKNDRKVSSIRRGKKFQVIRSKKRIVETLTEQRRGVSQLWKCILYYLQDKKIPDPATAEDLELFFENLTPKRKNRMETSIRERCFVLSDLQANAVYRHCKGLWILSEYFEV